MNSIMEIVQQTETLFNASEICRAEAVRVAALARKLESRDITVSVIGQFKRGKSTLVNGMLGDKILPVGIVPVTSVVTQIKYGEKSAKVHFENGAIKSVPVEILAEYICEQKNPDNRLCVSSVTLHTPSSFLKQGLIFVDTPGVGSVHKHNSEAAYAFVKESDAVIFMLSVDSPINEIEMDFLRNAAEYAAKFYFVINKIDIVDEEELTAYLEYCRSLICKLMGTDQLLLFPVSAKQGRGLSELKERILADCERETQGIIENSVRMKLRDVVDSALAQLELYWNAMKMPIGKFDRRFTQLEADREALKEEARQKALWVDEAESAIGLKWKEAGEQWFQEYQMMIAPRRIDLRGRLEELCERNLEIFEGEFQRIRNELEIWKNEMKGRLSFAVSELFGMEYHYEIVLLDLDEKKADGLRESELKGRGPFSPKKIVETAIERYGDDMEQILNYVCLEYHSGLGSDVKWIRGKFLEETTGFCDELGATLNHILLYRETSSFAVAKKIGDLNRWTKELKEIARLLNAMPPNR